MNDLPTPTLLRRQLGAELRKLRLNLGLTAEEVAVRLSVDTSTISRIETGARTASPDHLDLLIKVYRPSDEEAAGLRSLGEGGRRRVRRSAVRETDYVRIEQTGFVELETDAVRVREFNSGTFPGLLQTVDYMRANMAGTAPDADESAMKQAIRVRLKRQEKFQVKFSYEVVLDEAALHRLVGGPQVMADQIRATLNQIDEGKVDFSIIPFINGAHPGACSQFVALAASEDKGVEAVFAEGLFGQLEFRKPDDVERFDRMWLRLRSQAWTGARSRNVLEQAIARFER